MGRHVAVEQQSGAGRQLGQAFANRGELFEAGSRLFVLQHPGHVFALKVQRLGDFFARGVARIQKGLGDARQNKRTGLHQFLVPAVIDRGF